MWPERSSDPVYVEQVRSSYLNLPLALSVSILNSILLGFVLAPVVPILTVLEWTGFVVGLSCVRAVVWYAHRRLDVGPDLPTALELSRSGRCLALRVVVGGRPVGIFASR